VSGGVIVFGESRNSLVVGYIQRAHYYAKCKCTTFPDSSSSPPFIL
jgi:hypothetical protein